MTTRQQQLPLLLSCPCCSPFLFCGTFYRKPRNSTSSDTRPEAVNLKPSSAASVAGCSLASFGEGKETTKEDNLTRKPRASRQRPRVNHSCLAMRLEHQHFWRGVSEGRVAVLLRRAEQGGLLCSKRSRRDRVYPWLGQARDNRSSRGLIRLLNRRPWP